MYQILVSSLCTSHVLSKCFEAQKFFISAIMKTESTFSIKKDTFHLFYLGNCYTGIEMEIKQK